VRILVVTTWYPSERNPVDGVFVQRHVEAIASRHDVHVVHVTAGEAGAAPQDPWPVTVLSRRPSRLPASLAALRRLAARWRPDVVHTMAFSALPAGAVLGRGRPWLHTEHWSGVSDPRSVSQTWARLARARHLLRLPDAVTTVSTYLGRAMAPFVAADRLLVVPNVVHGPAVPSPRPSLGPQQLNLLAVGSLNAIKNPVLAVDSLAVLRERGLDARLRWVGGGPLSEVVRSRAERLGLGATVELTGQVPPDALAEHHRWSSCFFLPTQHETFCLAGAEALAHGRPAVLGARGGQQDYMSPQVGALVADQSPHAYADALVDVRARLSDVEPEALASAVRTRFSLAAVADDFDRAYQLADERA
jgi:glycosyltransferase involved in cell wall biosynthesis